MIGELLGRIFGIVMFLIGVAFAVAGWNDTILLFIPAFIFMALGWIVNNISIRGR